MDIKKELKKQTEDILRENGGMWLVVAQELLSRVESLEMRLAMYEHKESPAPAQDPFTAEDWAEAAEYLNGEKTTTPTTDWEQKNADEFDPDTQPNGHKCLMCGIDLHGTQRRFCSKPHANAYYYVRKNNPEATEKELDVIIVGSGWREPGSKYRKYKKFDKDAAPKLIARALASEVPAMN